ncbi:MAG: lipoprotein [Gammaproteobacteria bacterium]|nr:lipoprotein [Gammaproteobacteria bacterium]MBV9621646.1 lipoprotein [Gammaproteobacteria bacterium]
MSARLAWLLVPLLTLSGCGQKGPLYLPDKGAGIVTTPAPAENVPAPAASTPAPPPPPPAPRTDDDPDGQRR